MKQPSLSSISHNTLHYQDLPTHFNINLNNNDNNNNGNYKLSCQELTQFNRKCTKQPMQSSYEKLQRLLTRKKEHNKQKEETQKAHPAVPWDPASSPWISRLFIRIIALSLTVVAMAASLRLDGDPTLPLVDMDWPPETVVPHDLVAPPKPPLPLETVDEFLFPSSWLLLLLWFPIFPTENHMKTEVRPKKKLLTAWGNSTSMSKNWKSCPIENAQMTIERNEV